MAWRHWFTRQRNIINEVNNEVPVVDSLTPTEILAWSLEPRMLFDGAIAATVHDTATAESTHTETASTSSDAKTVTQSENNQTPSSAQENNSVASTNADSTTASATQESSTHVTDAAAPAPDAARHEVVFIDTSLKDYQTLAAGVGPGVEVVLIDGSKDGLQQIADWAATHTGYDAIHIFSHGSEGKINLGSSVLSSTTLSSDAVQTALAAIGKALTTDGDILLYGCDVGASSSGDALLAGIASATGADVAASTDATGSSLMGGNWTLEKTVGVVEAHALHVDAYQDLMTELTFSSSDPDLDYTHTGITRPVEGYDITFATSPDGYLSADNTFGPEGLYAYSGTGNVTSLTISSPAGTTFDINAMVTGAKTGTLHFDVQFGNGTSQSFDLSVTNNGFTSVTSFPYALNDITSVTITSQDYSAFESITITDVKSAAASAAPVIGNLNGDSVNFIEGGSPVLLDAGSNATVTDSDSTDFSGGNVTVSFAGNGVSGQDVLSVQNQGTGAGQIGLSGTSVTWGGVVIGTLSGGSNGSALSIALNGSATPEAVQGLVRALTWQNTNTTDPSTLTRTITVTVNDGDGGTSTAATVSVNVTGVNDAPTLNAVGSSPTYTENGSAVTLFSGAVVSTIESGQSIDQLTLTVSNLSNGSSEILNVDGTSISLINGASGTTTNGISYSVSLSGGTATLTLSSAAGLSTTATASLVNGITYRNSSENPGTASRVVTLTSVRDNGGTSNGGINVTALSITSTVSVVAVNDAPTVTAPTGITVTEDTAKAITGVSFSDVDAGSAAVVVTFSVNSGALSAMSGSGVTIGLLSSTSMTLTGTIADINAYIAAGNLSFLPASNSTTTATLNVSINDGGNSGTGGAQVVSTTIALNIDAVNDAPVNTVPSSQSVTQDGSLVFSTGNGNAISVSDVDVGSNQLQITLTATNGLLTLSTTSGLSFLTGTGTANGTMTFLGTQAAINAALNGLSFTPSSGYSGSASLQIVTNDLGSTGSGGAQTDTDTVAITVNATAPLVTGITSGSANGTYGIGSTVFVTVNFSDNVTVDTTGGTPTLLLETGAIDRTATYVSGSGTNALTFSYTVQAGDRSVDLDYNSMSALALNGATIRDGGGNDAQLTLAAPGAAGSLGANANVVVDGVRPTATITLSDNALRIGETSTVTITFSEAVSGFSNQDLTVSNGTLSAVSSADGGITWTAIFTPASNITSTNNMITLDNTGVIDQAGNTGTGVTESGTYQVDTQRPTATIVVSDDALRVGETSLVTITFSEAVTGFTNQDLTIANGTLSTVSSADGGITWTATFTPTSNITSTSNVITLDNSGVTDLAGNAGSGSTDSNTYQIDTQRPTATIVVSDTALKAGETSLVTITFSEAVSDFTNQDLTVSNGTLSAVSSSDGGITWTATFTPTANLSSTGNLITLDNSGVNDLAGNAGTGTTESNAYSLDTQRPTATIVISDTTLSMGETSLVTITFSEAVTGFTNGALTVTGGTLSTVSSMDGGITWTGIFTPASNITSTGNVITLDNSSVTDEAGNSGSGTTDSNAYQVDTQRPTATIVIRDTIVGAGQTSLVTITFSEAVTGFSNAALTVNGGTLSAVSSADGGITWTATFTPTPGSNSTGNLITLNNNDVSDLVGNAGAGTTESMPFTVDTQRPTATIVVSDAALKSGQTSTVTIVFSEAVTGFDLNDLTVSNGTLSNLVTTDGGITWTATFTPATGVIAAANHISLNNAGIQDLAGNRGEGNTQSAGFSIDTSTPGTSGQATLPSRGEDSQPIVMETPLRSGGQSQLSLLTLPVQGSFQPGTTGEGVPTLMPIFRAADQRGAVGSSALANVFSQNGAAGYDPGIHRTQVSDINQPLAGHSTLASVFGEFRLPGVNALEVFSGSSWQHVSRGSIAPLVAPTSVFGAPVFSLQLQQVTDDESQQLASLAGALQNIKPSV